MFCDIWKAVETGWDDGIDGVEKRFVFATARWSEGSELLEPLAVVPGHPLGRVCFDVGMVALQPNEILEGIRPIELACVNQAHVKITDSGAVRSLVKHRILAMNNRLLQHSLA